MDVDLTGCAVPELLRLWAGTMAELNARGLVRTNNNPVGDLAEAIAHEHYGGERGSFSQKGWDIRTLGGERIQVKGMRRTASSRRNLSAIRDSDYDIVLVVTFDENFDLTECFTLTRATVEAEFNHRPHVNGRIITVTNRLLASDLITLVDLRGAYQRISAPREPPETVNTAGDVR